MRWFAAFGVSVVLLTMTAGDRGLPALFKARREIEQISREIAALKAENAVLRAHAAALRHDARTIEVVARETLGMARAGEVVVLRRATP